MVIVFDLDDTLYDETTYVKSGFKAVASFLHTTYQLPAKEVYLDLLAELEKGRGSIFDSVLKKKHIFSEKLTRKCVTVYRFHKPEIKLDTVVVNCLKRFKGYPVYIVTDGNKIVQHNKIKALGLDKKVKGFYITHRYGVQYAKPSSYCFLKICEREKTTPDQVVYIADNLHKDFVGIKPLGFKTIRMLTGPYANIQKHESYHADMKISSLDELTDELISKVFRSKKLK